MKGEILNRYTVGAITTGCRRLAEEHAERGGHEIQLHQWPRPPWYKTPNCRCGCSVAAFSESELNKQLTLF